MLKLKLWAFDSVGTNAINPKAARIKMRYFFIRAFSNELRRTTGTSYSSVKEKARTIGKPEEWPKFQPIYPRRERCARRRRMAAAKRKQKTALPAQIDRG